MTSISAILAQFLTCVPYIAAFSSHIVPVAEVSGIANVPAFFLDVVTVATDFVARLR